jgi:hypothetical protein
VLVESIGLGKDGLGIRRRRNSSALRSCCRRCAKLFAAVATLVLSMVRSSDQSENPLAIPS